MANSGSQVGSYIFGGLFIGAWLYVLLFDLPGESINLGRWGFWGLMGIVLAASIYASRLTEGSVRIALFVGIGIALAMVLMALLMREIEEGWATLLTFLGAGLIVSAMPRVNESKETN